MPRRTERRDRYSLQQSFDRLRGNHHDRRGGTLRIQEQLFRCTGQTEKRFAILTMKGDIKSTPGRYPG